MMIDTISNALSWLAGLPAALVNWIGSLTAMQLVLALGVICLIVAVFLWPEYKDVYYDFLEND